jgi:hypothetical protein
MAGVQIHDAINPKDDQSRTPMQCWRAQSDAHTAPCGLSLLPGTERQSLLPVAKHLAAAFQSSMGLAAGTHQRVHGGSGPVVGPRCRGHEGAGAGSPALSAALAALYPSQRPWRTQICSTQGLAYLPHHHFVLKTDVGHIMRRLTTNCCWIGWRCISLTDRSCYHWAVFPALCGAGWLILGPHARHRVGRPAQSDSGGVFLD